MKTLNVHAPSHTYPIFIGNLFKTRQNSQSRRELLIFITPRIMDTVGSNLRY